MNMSINISFDSVFDADYVFLYNLTSKGHSEVILRSFKGNRSVERSVARSIFLKKFYSNQTQSRELFA